MKAATAGSNIGAGSTGKNRAEFLITASDMSAPAILGAMANMQGLSAVSMRLGNQLSTTLNNVQGAVIGMGMGAAIGIGYAAMEAANFEHGMAQVQAVSGKTQEQIYSLGEEAKLMAMKYGTSIDELTSGLTTLGRAGLNDSATQSQVLEEALKMAKMEGLELNSALEMLISTANLFNIDELGMDSAGYGDFVATINEKLITASQLAPLEVKDLTMSLKYVGGLAKEANMDIDDLLGTLSELASKGVKGDVAGTALRQFLIRPSARVGPSVDALSSIGMNPEDLWDNQGNKAKGIAEQIRLIRDRMDELNLSTMAQIEFWNKFSNIKAGAQMMKVDPDSVDRFAEKIQEGIDLEERMNNLLDTVKAKWNKLIEGLRVGLINIGDKALIIIEPIIDGFIWLTEVLANNPIFSWVAAFGLLGGTLMGATIAINWLGKGVMYGIESMKGFGFSVMGVGETLGFFSTSEQKAAIYTQELASVQAREKMALDAINLTLSQATTSTGVHTAAIKAQTTAMEEQIIAASALNKAQNINAVPLPAVNTNSAILPGLSGSWMGTSFGDSFNKVEKSTNELTKAQKELANKYPMGAIPITEPGLWTDPNKKKGEKGRIGNFLTENFLDQSFLKNNNKLQTAAKGNNKAMSGLANGIMGLASPAGIALAAVTALAAGLAISFLSWQNKLEGAKKGLEKNKEKLENHQKALWNSYNAREAEKNKINGSKQAIDNYTNKINIQQAAVNAAAASISRYTREIVEAETDPLWGNFGVNETFWYNLGMYENKINDTNEGLMYLERAQGQLMDIGNSNRGWSQYLPGAFGSVAQGVSAIFGQVDTLQQNINSITSGVSIWFARNAKHISKINTHYKELSQLYDKESELISQYGSKEMARASNEWKESMDKVSNTTKMTAKEIEAAMDMIEIQDNVAAADSAMGSFYDSFDNSIESMKVLSSSGGNDAMINAIDANSELQQQLIDMNAIRYGQQTYHEIWWMRSWNIWMMFFNNIAAFWIGLGQWLWGWGSAIAQILTNIPQAVGGAVYNAFAGWFNSKILAPINNISNSLGMGDVIPELPIVTVPGLEQFNKMMNTSPFDLMKKESEKRNAGIEQTEAMLGQIYGDKGVNLASTIDMYKAIGNEAAKGDNRASKASNVPTGEGGGTESLPDSGKGKGGKDDKDSNKITVDFAICKKKIMDDLNVNLMKKGPLFNIEQKSINVDKITTVTRGHPEDNAAAVKNSIIEADKNLTPRIISKKEKSQV